MTIDIEKLHAALMGHFTVYLKVVKWGKGVGGKAAKPADLAAFDRANLLWSIPTYKDANTGIPFDLIQSLKSAGLNADSIIATLKELSAKYPAMYQTVGDWQTVVRCRFEGSAIQLDGRANFTLVLQRSVAGWTLPTDLLTSFVLAVLATTQSGYIMQ